MMRSFAVGEYYHLYNRGTEKRSIFTSRADRDRFLALLYLANQEAPIDSTQRGSTSLKSGCERSGDSIVEVMCYCLMPNHFHLLVREIADGGISKYMQKLMTGYTMYFNKKNERNGALFQGKFKASHVANDRYLRYLVSYIHLNPVKLIDPKWKEDGITDKTRAEEYLQTYTYSSYLDYLGKKRPEGVILAPEALPAYFSSGADFETFVTEWLTYGPENSEVEPRQI